MSTENLCGCQHSRVVDKEDDRCNSCGCVIPAGKEKTVILPMVRNPMRMSAPIEPPYEEQLRLRNSYGDRVHSLTKTPTGWTVILNSGWHAPDGHPLIATTDFWTLALDLESCTKQ